MSNQDKYDREWWNSFCRVFDLSVDVTVKKKVRKSDVIMALLDEGEIAFNGGEHSGSFVMKINKNWNFNILKTLVWDAIRKYKNESEEKDFKNRIHKAKLKSDSRSSKNS